MIFGKKDDEINEVLEARGRYLTELYGEDLDLTRLDQALNSLRKTLLSSKNPCHYYLLKAGKQVLGIGFLTVQAKLPSYADTSNKKGIINGVYVYPHYRHKGFGTQIVQELVSMSERLGLETVELEASEHAVPLYRSLGFEEVVSSDIPMRLTRGGGE